jgi:hypothetical protein
LKNSVGAFWPVIFWSSDSGLRARSSSGTPRQGTVQTYFNNLLELTFDVDRDDNDWGKLTSRFESDRMRAEFVIHDYVQSIAFCLLETLQDMLTRHTSELNQTHRLACGYVDISVGHDGLGHYLLGYTCRQYGTLLQDAQEGFSASLALDNHAVMLIVHQLKQHIDVPE